MPKLALPCVRCQKRAGFHFPSEESRYRFRCPGCRIEFEVRVYRLLGFQTITRKKRTLPGILKLVDPGQVTGVEFRLELLDELLETRQEIPVSPWSADAGIGDLRSGVQLGLVYREDTLIAISNLDADTWFTTHLGGWWRAAALVPFMEH